MLIKIFDYFIFVNTILLSYAGDARIKAKVKGIVCGIKDIQFVGDLRIILSPLINTIPLVGAVTYFFLKKPVSINEQKRDLI
jgi:hypothetical protein